MALTSFTAARNPLASISLAMIHQHVNYVWGKAVQFARSVSMPRPQPCWPWPIERGSAVPSDFTPSRSTIFTSVTRKTGKSSLVPLFKAILYSLSSK